MTPDPRHRLSAKTILVVEDEVVVRAVLCETLRSAGYTVVEVSAVDEALDVIMAGADIDLVFSDVRTPGALSGVDMARRLAEERPGLPVILASGNLDPEQLSGLKYFMAKPYKLERALKAVEELIGRPSESDGQ